MKFVDAISNMGQSENIEPKEYKYTDFMRDNTLIESAIDCTVNKCAEEINNSAVACAKENKPIDKDLVLNERDNMKEKFKNIYCELKAKANDAIIGIVNKALPFATGQKDFIIGNQGFILSNTLNDANNPDGIEVPAKLESPDSKDSGYSDTIYISASKLNDIKSKIPTLAVDICNDFEKAKTNVLNVVNNTMGANEHYETADDLKKLNELLCGLVKQFEICAKDYCMCLFKLSEITKLYMEEGLK